MTRLFLVRHGLAVAHGTPGIADDDRPLTSKGERRMRQVAFGLKRLSVKPDVIVTSPLPRARSTAEIIAEVLKRADSVENSDELRAGRTAEAIRDWLATRKEEKLMIVGHDPAFSDLIGLLLTGSPGHCHLHKGGVAAFRSGAEGTFELDWLARPKLFRRLLL